MASDPVVVKADIFPAAISPHPDGVPLGKLRVIISSEGVVCAWSLGRNGLEAQIGTKVIPISPEELAAAGPRGGQAGGYAFSRGRGCACGAAGLRNWNPFPDRTVKYR